MRSRSSRYNPDMGGQYSQPGLYDRQNAAMSRGHASIANDIIQTKKAIALEEKRQREKEASLKREVTYYNSLRKSALTLAKVNGADVATRYKAISAAKEVLDLQRREHYTVEETRFEMARITTELRKQARLQQRITREQKAAGVRAGRVRTESRGGSVGLAAAGIIGGGSLIGSMGVARVGQTLQGSLERSREAQQLRQYDISQLEFNAIHDVVQKRTGYDLTVDKYASMNKDYFEKAGELINTGSFKTNKQGVTTFSGGGELADLVNAVLSKTNQRTAQKVIGELQKLDMGTFVTYVRQLGKQFGWTENSMRHFLEAIDDGSVLLSGLTGEGDEVIARMHQLASEGWTLSDAQQANLDKLAALGAEYNRVQTSLADHFSASFVQGLGEYATNTDTLRQSMTGLIPIADNLGQSLGELTTNVIAWASQIGGELQNGATLPTAIYNTTVDEGSNAAAQWIKDKTGFDPRVIGQTLKQIYPWLDSSAQNNIGSGQAWTNPGLTRGVAGFSQPQITFTPPEPFGSTGWRPDSSRFNLTGEATVKVEVEQTLNAGVLDNLIDTKINDNNVRQQNMILGIAD
ncbi:TPA: chemotaxis protein [Klebsiella pneumoniae]|nr:chemotaxis protein [Klebsiella pneumoniae]HDU2757456.1 chemotaxis protein [Klebsiella pneumoniae]HDU2775978.1 chemotaxis protein [Klebsiella pneumoniae]HDU2784636.1 chemotaxis protein [Klebsiella pneumoniae]HDU2795452.1 chemotaxis protein [Klebsiella pneumoniae]